MKLDQFNTVVDEQIHFCLSTLDAKSEEYVFGDDRLEHFKITAVSQGTNPKQALWGMLAKHLTSLTGMCKSDKPETLSRERWTEKITDSINYLLLLRALVEEDFDNEQN